MLKKCLNIFAGLDKRRAYVSKHIFLRLAFMMFCAKTS